MTCSAKPHSGTHLRITISAEDMGEISNESPQAAKLTSHGSSLGTPKSMSQSWMSFGDSDSSRVGTPVTKQFYMVQESQERNSREYDFEDTGFNSAEDDDVRGRGNFYSRFLNDDDDDDFSGEFDDDDLARMSRSLGRRYHPTGVPLINKPLFIPPPASPMSKSLTGSQHINSPYMVSLKDSAEDLQDAYEDAFDDSGENFIPMVRMLHANSHQNRIAMPESGLGNRYNFVDNHGSVNWGYDLDDQYQHQVVRQDGSMQGEYGWDSPDGNKVHIQYTAGKNGFRVVSSLGMRPEDDDDYIPHLPGTGVPLPGQGNPNFGSPNNNQGFGSNSAGVPLPNPSGGFGNEFAGNPNNFGVPMPNPGVGEGNSGFPSSGPDFGVPIPPPGNNQGGGSQDFGIPMPPPGNNQGGGSQDFGIPMPPPGIGQDGPVGFPGDFGGSENFPEGGSGGFGVPIPPPGPGSDFSPSFNSANTPGGINDPGLTLFNEDSIDEIGGGILGAGSPPLGPGFNLGDGPSAPELDLDGVFANPGLDTTGLIATADSLFGVDANNGPSPGAESDGAFPLV